MLANALSGYRENLMDIIVELDVKIVFTSAGNPKTWTGLFKKKKGIM